MNRKQTDIMIEMLILISLLAENLAKQLIAEQELARMSAMHSFCMKREAKK